MNKHGIYPKMQLIHAIGEVEAQSGNSPIPDTAILEPLALAADQLDLQGQTRERGEVARGYLTKVINSKEGPG